MAKYCPLKDGGPALYLECKECENKVCEEEDDENA